MHVLVEFHNLQNIQKIIGNSLLVDIKGNSFSDLFFHMMKKYDSVVQDELFDFDGHIHIGIQIVMNKKYFIKRKDIGNIILHEGDHVLFMLPASGG